MDHMDHLLSSYPSKSLHTQHCITLDWKELNSQDEIDNLIQRDPTIVEKDLNHDPVALELKGFRCNIKGSCFIANCICLSVVEDGVTWLLDNPDESLVLMLLLDFSQYADALMLLGESAIGSYAEKAPVLRMASG
ncbi:hypothetical protein MRB53_021713 [Persea americana]|uniref:Uncharacterized protein n=1 Tax=Persea americana TaxID=3435 RepID=A0ACC2L4G3_PERAE|nr:hypothetical protein MRB53_021713 [Persea americana]